LLHPANKKKLPVSKTSMSNNLKQEFNRLASNAKHVPAPSVAADVSVSEFAMPAPGA
jgi:hypothetical protein